MLYRVKEAAKVAGIGQTKAYEMVKTGQWPVVFIGADRYVPADELRAWIKKNTVRLGEADGRRKTAA